MAAMTFEPRDPDMAHFIDTYKYDRQMEEKRKVFGGGTVSYHLCSWMGIDIGTEAI